MTTAQTTYCHTLRLFAWVAFIAVGLVNLVSGGASTEWGVVPAWLLGGLL